MPEVAFALGEQVGKYVWMGPSPLYLSPALELGDAQGYSYFRFGLSGGFYGM